MPDGCKRISGSRHVIENQFYSFHYSQVPGFDKLYELSRQHSYAPTTVDPLCFKKLTPDDPLFARRESLEQPPDEATILEKEFQLSLSNKKASQRRLSEDEAGRASRDVEASEHRKVLNSLRRDTVAESLGDGRELNRREVKHRVASGYVKLDERRSRLASLIEGVDDFFGQHCHCQGDYWYPRGGFRDWHTNKFDAPGWRLYIIDTDVPQQSFFRLKHPRTNEIITVWDEPGTFNFFLIDPRRLLWHCIGAPNADRWSKGFVIPDTWLDSVVSKIAGR